MERADKDLAGSTTLRRSRCGEREFFAPTHYRAQGVRVHARPTKP